MRQFDGIIIHTECDIDTGAFWSMVWRIRASILLAFGLVWVAPRLFAWTVVTIAGWMR
jgi:hypothetical protein